MSRIYLHGAGLNASIWDDVPGTCLNLPGHGGTTRVKKASATTFVEALEPQIQSGSTLIGHSLGGMIAMAFAATYPERIKALILVSTPVRAPLRFISWYTPFVAPIVTRVPGRAAIARVVGSRVENPEAQVIFKRNIRASDPGALADALIVAGSFDGNEVLYRLKMPMLAVIGQRSLLTRGDYRERLQAACPQIQFAELDSSHMIPLDAPAALEKAIASFEANLD